MANKFIIKAELTGGTGKISLIGDIDEWSDSNATTLRQNCEMMKQNGITNCIIYVMTYGGDCFQANEMKNILDEYFPVSYNGEGGSIVASAGTYLAVGCNEFEMAENGQFMIHKPMGGAFGTENEVESKLQLIKNMTALYYNAYLAKCKKPEAEFKAKWDAGDFWMTAQEAKDWGFITSVKKAPAKVDTGTKNFLEAHGKYNEFTNPLEPNNDMDQKVIARQLGMADTATEEQINAKIAENARKMKEFEVLQASTIAREKEEKNARIKALLDKAEQDKKIKADTRKQWEKMLDSDEEGTTVVLASLQPIEKLSGLITANVNGAVVANYQGKTFEQIQDEDPDMLMQLEEQQPEVFAALFADYKKRKLK